MGKPDINPGTSSGYRDDFSRGEVVQAFVWMCIFAAIAVMLQVGYFWAPLAIVFAGWFNAVLRRTAKLWTPNPWIQLVPLGVWVVGFWMIVGKGPSISEMLLLLVGIIWPLATVK